MSQLFRVRQQAIDPGNIDRLNVELGKLPQLIAHREQQRQNRLTSQMHREDMALRKKALKQEKEMSKKTTLLEAGKTGAEFLMSGTGKSLFGGIKGIFSKKGSQVPAAGTTAMALRDTPRFAASSNTGLFSRIKPNLTLGTTAGAGLAGFGAGKLFGGSRGKKALLGAGLGMALAGGIPSLFGDKFNFGKAAIGGFFGGLGGLFS